MLITFDLNCSMCHVFFSLSLGLFFVSFGMPLCPKACFAGKGWKGGSLNDVPQNITADSSYLIATSKHIIKAFKLLYRKKMQDQYQIRFWFN